MTGGLEIRGIEKRFGEVSALSGVNLSVQRGQLVGFLGPNGAGKTTTMRSVLGLLSVDAGTITWDGAPMSPDLRRDIGYMPQERGLYPRMKVHEHIAYIARLAGIPHDESLRRADKWVERVGVEEKRDSLIQELSVGNQQRVQLGVALVHEPSLLVLDEPFAGLDPLAVSTLRDVMMEQVQSGVSVVYSSHQLDIVQDLTEHVTIIAGGSTKRSGTVTDLRAESPHRILEIHWDGEPPNWIPPNGSLRTSVGTTTTFEVPAETDASQLISAASKLGQISSVRFEPPELSEVFLGLVES